MSLNFTFNRKNISSEEISAKMNFREVLSNYKIVTKPFYQTGWFYAATVVTLASIATVLILNTGSTGTETKPSDPNETTAAGTVTYKEDSPCIKPPRKEADVPFTIYSVNNAEGGKIIHHSGTEINIPEKAFTLNGKPVEGDVEIRYREFRDAADFIASGIPMTYDSAGTTLHFESAGMLEVRAFQNGQEVELNGEIGVHLASDYGDTKYNFYQLDEKNNQWLCIGKDKVSEPGNTNTDVKPADPEKIKDQIVKNEAQLVEVKKEIAELKKSGPEEPHKKNALNYSFKLDVLDEEFPELKELKNQRFEVAATEKTFSEKVFEAEWENVRIDKSKINGKYYLTLTKNSRDKRYEVYPVFEGAEYTQKKAAFDKEFASSAKILEARLAEEKKLEAETARLRQESVKKSKDLTKEWEKKRAEQVTMPTEEMLAGTIHPVSRPDANARLVAGTLANGDYKYDRQLKLPSLGVFNCDNAVSRPIKEKGKKHKFQFRDKNGVPLIMTIIYVLEKKRNVMFTYQPHEFESIKIQEDVNHSIVGITKDGSVAIANAMDLRVLNWEEKTLDLSMQVFESLKDPNELRTLLNPNS